LSVRPSLIEYTGYSIVGTGTSIIGATVFLYVFPQSKLTLRQWAMGCYALVAFCAVWCLIGLNANSPIGFKHRAEFYVFQVIQNLAGSVLSPLFRVLFPQVFPNGSEIQYFGFQLVVGALTE
jgi:MFS-type transporter involved in bile tolerance (Atg22 family)